MRSFTCRNPSSNPPREEESSNEVGFKYFQEDGSTRAKSNGREAGRGKEDKDETKSEGYYFPPNKSVSTEERGAIVKCKATVYPYIYPSPSVEVEVDAISIQDARLKIQEKLNRDPPSYNLIFDSISKIWFACSSCEEDWELDSVVTCSSCEEAFCSDCYEQHLQDVPACYAASLA